MGMATASGARKMVSVTVARDTPLAARPTAAAVAVRHNPRGTFRLRNSRSCIAPSATAERSWPGA